MNDKAISLKGKGNITPPPPKNGVAEQHQIFTNLMKHQKDRSCICSQVPGCKKLNCVSPYALQLISEICVDHLSDYLVWPQFIIFWFKGSVWKYELRCSFWYSLSRREIRVVVTFLLPSGSIWITIWKYLGITNHCVV